jgi:hypothetical protein
MKLISSKSNHLKFGFVLSRSNPAGPGSLRRWREIKCHIKGVEVGEDPSHLIRVPLLIPEPVRQKERRLSSGTTLSPAILPWMFGLELPQDLLP